jgi:hypothetical protein
MDVQQLKLLAGRIRDLLEHANVSVTHSQALDLSSALVGLRNWPEVQAFPSRVAGAELDLTATGRLSHRLARKHALELPAPDLLAALRSDAGPDARQDLPQIWPTGPRAGVYITTEQERISALLQAYDDATDGALLYAERAGSHWAGSIDMGDDGLRSSSLERVPSGTLLVLGPLDLNEQSWSDVGSRLESACLSAQAYGHRVAVLVRTESPATLFHDVDLAVRMQEPEGDDVHEALLGVVNAAGELVVRSPFVEPLPAPELRPSPATTDAIPAEAIPLLEAALKRSPTGLLLLGSSELTEHWAIDLVNAVLPLTDFAGPAARIRPRQRSTPAKDWDVPEGIKALPFLPSVDSAYSLGYRRMVVTTGYTDVDVLAAYSDRVLFITGGYGGSVDDLYMDAIRSSGFDKLTEVLEALIAIVGVTRLKTPKVETSFTDMYVPDGHALGRGERFSAVVKLLRGRRCLRAEDELSQLLDTRQVTPAAVKKALERTKWVTELLAARKAGDAVAAR